MRLWFRRFSTTPAYALAMLLLATATVLVYAAGLHGPFLMDDYDAIWPLAAAERELSWWETLRNAPYHIRNRWLSNFSLLLTQAASGSPLPPRAFAYKLGNLLVHLATAGAAALLARQLARQWGASATRAAWVAVLAASLFALHPLLVSTVLYPVQRMAQLATLFALLAVWAYVRWRARIETASPREHVIGIAMVLGYTALAVLSKENGVLAPLLILAVELTAFRWPAKDTEARGRFEAGFGLACAAPLMLGAVLLGLRWESMMAGYAGRDFTLAERVMTQLHVLADYLGHILWPRIGGMGLYRDDFAVTHALDASTLALGLACAAGVALAVWQRRAWPALALGWLWFLAAHALESTVLPLELVFEHRNYLALFGPALALAWTITTLKSRPVAIVVAAAALVALGTQTARRSDHWRDYETWLRAELRHHPASLRANSDWVLYLTARERGDEAEETIAALRRQLPAHAQVAILELRLRCSNAGTAAENLDAATEAALTTGPIGKDAFHLYTSLRDRKAAGRCDGLGWRALAQAATAVARNPHHRGYATALAAWHRLAAQAWAEAGDWRATRASIEQALAHRDDDPRDWLLLAEAGLVMGDAGTYRLARQRAIGLVGGRASALAEALNRLDTMSRNGILQPDATHADEEGHGRPQGN